MKETFGGNERATEQDIDRKNGGYGGDYYDENEHRAGQEKRDLATGNEFRNDGDIKAIAVEELREKGLLNSDKALKSEFNDDTEKWLRENDPQYIGLGKVRREKEDEKGYREAA